MSDDAADTKQDPMFDPTATPAEQPKWSNLPTVSFRKLQRKTLGQILVESESLTEEQLQACRPLGRDRSWRRDTERRHASVEEEHRQRAENRQAQRRHGPKRC